MDYFSSSVDYIKKNPARSLIIFILDIVFYLLFIPISHLVISLIVRQISRVPIQTMGAVMQSLEIEALQQLQKRLIGIILGIFGSISLFFLLVLLNIAVLKTIVWLVTLKKNIDYKSILKGTLLVFIFGIIFFIPIILSLYPFVSLSKEYSATQILNVNIIHFIPLLAVFFISFYVSGIAIYFLAKEGRLRKAIKSSFVSGWKRFPALFLPFIGLFAVAGAVAKLLFNLKMLGAWYGLIILLLCIVSVSFFNRIYIKEKI